MKTFKVIQQLKQNEKDRREEYVKDSIRSPLKFYNLLLLAGENAVKARDTIYTIKFAELRSSNVKYRKQLIRMLREFIDICTTDKILYTRLRQLALAHNLDGIKQIKENHQGVTGTGLGIANSAPSTTGIDSYDTPLSKIARRFPNQFKKRRI